MTGDRSFMDNIVTLEDALKRIEKLEYENAKLKEANDDLRKELEYFKKKKGLWQTKT